jgi:hypothetical protein
MKTWRIGLLCGVLAVCGCTGVSRPQLSSLWPWRAAPAPAPAAVRELQVSVPADMPMPIVLQYWDRNALLIDMQGVASSGAFTLAPRAGADWPVRLEFRVPTGRFAVLELAGAQRAVYPISGGGSAPVVIAVDPGLYPPSAAQIAVTWGAAGR